MKHQTGRFLRYKLALDRLDESLEQSVLLEAISLKESIITDRLISILKAKGETVSTRKSLGRLISQAKIEITGIGVTDEGVAFYDLDQ